MEPSVKRGFACDRLPGFFGLALHRGFGDDFAVTLHLAINDNARSPLAGDGGPGCLRRLTAAGVALLPVALGGCLFLSWCAAMAVPVAKYAAPGSPPWVGGALLYVAFFSVLWGLLRKTGSIPEERVVAALIGGSAVLKLGLALWAMGMPLHADQELFHHFVREMADHRLDGGVLSGLSTIYDYPVWGGRVLPVHYAIRLLAGDRDLFWARLLNVGLSTAILLTTYGFARRLLPAGRRKWAVFLAMALPFQSFVVTDYSHHLFSSFYFLLGMGCAWDLVFADPRPGRRLALAVLAGVCLTLMMWQRGVHLIALGVWAGLILWAAAGGGFGLRRWSLLLLALGVLPLALSIPAAGRYDAWLNRHDAHRLNSVLPAFVARGWCPESAGEYCGRYEQLDRVTPWGGKKAAMFRLVLSQIRRNPETVCVRFPAAKTAKLFLVGYAANFEEGLGQTASRALPWVRGMRLAAAPIFLGLAVWGCLGLAARPRLQARWLPVLLAPLLTWGAYVFAGETSPRYSIFCQPFLALLGASALAGRAGRGGRPQGLPGGAWRSIAARAAVVAGGIALALGGAVAGVRWLPEHRLYADLERGWAREAGASAAPGLYRPFEARLVLPEDGSPARAAWRLPPRPGSADAVSFYVLQADGAARAARLAVGTDAGNLFGLPLEGLREPLYVELDLPAGAESLVFCVEPAPDAARAGGGEVHVGYVAFPERDRPE